MSDEDTVDEDNLSPSALPAEVASPLVRFTFIGTKYPMSQIGRLRKRLDAWRHVKLQKPIAPKWKKNASRLMRNLLTQNR